MVLFRTSFVTLPNSPGMLEGAEVDGIQKQEM
jgi:hypothetical protein